MASGVDGAGAGATRPHAHPTRGTRGAVIEFPGGFDRAVFVEPSFGRVVADRQDQALRADASRAAAGVAAVR